MRILVVRLGAYGDTIITTPVIRHLKQQGHEIYYLASERAMEVLENNPNISKIIYHKKDSVKLDKLGDYFKKIQQENQCDKIIDFCESIEYKLSLTPNQPQYFWSKKERLELCNKNFYEETFKHADIDLEEVKNYRPEVFFSDKEIDKNARFREPFIGKKIILWGLSGSSLHKSYPYTHLVMSYLLEKYKDLVFVTVGDEKCQILEQGLRHKRVIHKSNIWSFRDSMIMAKNAHMVIAPDTGLLHASGCFNTPKLGLLTAVTKENITKHFLNDFSVEADMHCAPCFRLIYNASIQCPCDRDLGTPFCNTFGLPPEKIINIIETRINLNEGI